MKKIPVFVVLGALLFFVAPLIAQNSIPAEETDLRSHSWFDNAWPSDLTLFSENS